jgi:hypothetical protein
MMMKRVIWEPKTREKVSLSALEGLKPFWEFYVFGPLSSCN